MLGRIHGLGKGYEHIQEQRGFKRKRKGVEKDNELGSIENGRDQIKLNHIESNQGDFLGQHWPPRAQLSSHSNKHA